MKKNHRYHVHCTRAYVVGVIARDGAAEILKGWTGTDEEAIEAVIADGRLVFSFGCDNPDETGKCAGHRLDDAAHPAPAQSGDRVLALGDADLGAAARHRPVDGGAPMIRDNAIQITLVPDSAIDMEPCFTRRWAYVPRIGDHVHADGKWWIVTSAHWHTANSDDNEFSYAMVTLGIAPEVPRV